MNAVRTLCDQEQFAVGGFLSAAAAIGLSILCVRSERSSSATFRMSFPPRPSIQPITRVGPGRSGLDNVSALGSQELMSTLATAGCSRPGMWVTLPRRRAIANLLAQRLAGPSSRSSHTQQLLLRLRLRIDQSEHASICVSNPADDRFGNGAHDLAGGFQRYYHTDLQLFRISEDPGLPALTDCSQPMPSNFTRSTAPEVVIIGDSDASARRLNGMLPAVAQLVWTQTEAPARQGYSVTASSDGKRFGTNRLADIRPNFNGDPGDGARSTIPKTPTSYLSRTTYLRYDGAFALKTLKE